MDGASTSRREPVIRHGFEFPLNHLEIVEACVDGPEASPTSYTLVFCA